MISDQYISKFEVFLGMLKGRVSDVKHFVSFSLFKLRQSSYTFIAMLLKQTEDSLLTLTEGLKFCMYPLFYVPACIFLVIFEWSTIMTVGTGD